MLPALTLTERQWHYQACLGTARLGDGRNSRAHGPGPPSKARSALAPCTWPSLGRQMLVPDAGRRCWSQISRHASSAQSCRSLFYFPPGTSITQGLQDQTRDQAELLRPPREMNGCHQGRDERGTKLRWRPGQAVSYSRRPNTSTAPRYRVCDTQTVSTAPSEHSAYPQTLRRNAAIMQCTTAPSCNFSQRHCKQARFRLVAAPSVAIGPSALSHPHVHLYLRPRPHLDHSNSGSGAERQSSLAR